MKLISSDRVPVRLMVVTGNFGGGTGSHLVGLLEQFDPANWSVQLVCQGPRRLDPPSHVALIEDTAGSRRLPFPASQWRQLQRLKALIRCFRPSVVHTFFFWPIVYGRILRRLGVIERLVENREDQGFNWGAFEYAVLRLTSGIPDRIVCVSEAVREVVLQREQAPPDRTLVVRNGVLLPAVPFPSRELRSAREEVGLAETQKVVGMVANLNRAVKGIGYFLEAAPLILARIPEARFLILGDGRDRTALEAQAEGLGVRDQVIFAGFRSDVARFYPIMDVSVLTSLSEGLSMTVLESMSFGVPVVVTRVGGNPELVRDGETGFLVPPKNPAEFAEAVVRVLLDGPLRERMGREGRLLVEREFSMTDVSRRYCQIYLDVLRSDPCYPSKGVSPA